MARFLVGVNYWPRSSGTEMWTRFDLTEVDYDFARMAQLELAVARVFLTWSAFAPAPDTLAFEPLDDFVALLDRAHEHGLRVIATLFFGHAAGANWLPAWALDRTRRADATTLVGAATTPWAAGDLYAGELLEAQRGLARAVGERAREHAALLAWDIGNAVTAVREPETLRKFEHRDAALAHDLLTSSNLGTTTSLRSDDIAGERSLDELASLAQTWKFPSLDALSGNATFAQRTSDGTNLPHIDLAPFLVQAFASRARRAPMVSAFGCASGESAGLPSHADARNFARASLERIHRAGALGALWWRWSDDLPDRRTLAPLDEAPELAAYGLIAADGSEKPVAHVLSEFAREHRQVAVPEPPEFSERALHDDASAAFAAYREEHRLNQDIS